MKKLFILLLVSCTFVLSTNISFAGKFKEVNHGDKVTIITPGILARLCPYPNCGENKHITRIPEGTVLVVEGKTDAGTKAWPVIWFEVTYKGKKGWISIFDTDKQ